MYSEPRFLLAGDKGLNMEFGNEINEEINQKIRATSAAISQREIPGIKELIPTYRSLLIIYEPLEISLKDLITELKQIQEGLDSLKLPDPIVSVIPVLYGGDMGPDLGFVAEHNNISPDEVIKIHTSTDYLIYYVRFYSRLYILRRNVGKDRYTKTKNSSYQNSCRLCRYSRQSDGDLSHRKPWGMAANWQNSFKTI